MTRRVIELREWETRDVRLDDTDVTALIAHPQRPAAIHRGRMSPLAATWMAREAVEDPTQHCHQG